MKTKISLFALFTITLLSIAMVITLLFNSAPDSKNIIGLLYLTVFLSITGIVFFTVYGVNWVRFQETPPWSNLVQSLRYGIITALYFAALLLLSTQRLLNYPDAITILVIAVVLELLWQKRRATKILQ